MFYALYAEKYINGEQWYRQHWSDVDDFIVLKMKSDMWLEASPYIEKFRTQNS